MAPLPVISGCPVLVQLSCSEISLETPGSSIVTP
jgi:hypothetical protein